MHEKHGHTQERLYRVWTQMRYPGYPAFRQWALANGYEPGLQIDREDQGYSPGNCRWVTSEKNNQNTRKSVHLTALGETKTVSAWARDPRCPVAEVTLWQRVQRGMAHEAAILTPNHRGRRNDLLTSGPNNDYRGTEQESHKERTK